MNHHQKTLPTARQEELFGILKTRFNKHKSRHKDIPWEKVREKLVGSPDKLWSLNEMEETGGEPDVVGYDAAANEYIFFDCSPESPKGRRSICYDREALNARKEHKPANSAMDIASEMGVEMLDENEYRQLQELGSFDAKTSSWLLTPPAIRKLGGAIFGDFRFGQVFIYHNGADSYYGARGFRASLRV